ncbi:GntR family transcriptional regulator [Rhodoligotrophos defluvii]|uniref:GntR family transcriptional regulator n=1 Tax=Rhodoligotrophos defluvii TaxID=2561934 RepID=UPI0010CA175A|nr:GntR family transcriptional regulator [Rhodoligotrophos defluvii]
MSDAGGDIAVGRVLRDNLTERVYRELRSALMEGRFWPGHRFKIRELAASLGVSETPVREALMQLVREKGLDMEAARSITVAELSLAQYLELREIRLLLEGLAAEAATPLISDSQVSYLAALHEQLIEAEEAGRWFDAVRANWDFHYGLYKVADRPELLAIIEGIWLRNGPLVNYQYPNARPTYPGRHRHLDILDALRARDAAAVREHVQNDMLEGGRLLVQLLGRLEAGEITREELHRDAHAARADAAIARRARARG